MSITRRTFVSGLVSMLTAIRIPGVSASKEVDMPEDKFGPFIEYLEVGECKDMLGGPATTRGWYLHPVCMIGCCISEGPFPSKEAALEVDRIRWESIAEISRNESTGDGGTGVLEPF